jgi:hypothetical protein
MWPSPFFVKINTYIPLALVKICPNIMDTSVIFGKIGNLPIDEDSPIPVTLN